MASGKQPSKAFLHDLTKELEEPFSRYKFNIEQICKKYGDPGTVTTGLVYDLQKDEWEYDNEYCNAENEEQHIKALKSAEAMDKRLYAFNGDSLLATPAPDPEEKSKENIDMWKKMNKKFEQYMEMQKTLAKAIGSKQKQSTSQRNSARGSHPYGKMQIAPGGDHLGKMKRAGTSNGVLRIGQLDDSVGCSSGSSFTKAKPRYSIAECSFAQGMPTGSRLTRSAANQQLLAIEAPSDAPVYAETICSGFVDDIPAQRSLVRRSMPALEGGSARGQHEQTNKWVAMQQKLTQNKTFAKPNKPQ